MTIVIAFINLLKVYFSCLINIKLSPMTCMTVTKAQLSNALAAFNGSLSQSSKLYTQAI